MMRSATIEIIFFTAAGHVGVQGEGDGERNHSGLFSFLTNRVPRN